MSIEDGQKTPTGVTHGTQPYEITRLRKKLANSAHARTPLFVKSQFQISNCQKSRGAASRPRRTSTVNRAPTGISKISHDFQARAQRDPRGPASGNRRLRRIWVR